jgi:hypothetical protein
MPGASGKEQQKSGHKGADYGKHLDKASVPTLSFPLICWTSSYFLEHWFDDTWLKTWCHFLLRDSASNDLNVSTNNNIESSWRVLSKTLTSKLVNDGSGSWGNKDTPLTPIKVLNGLVNFLEQSDFRFMQREVESAARRKTNPFVRRYADLRRIKNPTRIEPRCWRLGE